MGKRELLIAAAFIVAAAVAYQLTAPPPKPGQQPFSFSDLFSRARRAAQSDNASASTTSNLTETVAASVRELRIRDVHGAVRVTGENRADVEIEFTVQSTGPDKNAATNFAKSTKLKVDTADEALIIHADYPQGGRQVGTLALKVPRRLAVRLDGATGVTVSGVAALILSSITGETAISDVAGTVGGDYRSGALQVSDAGALDLTLNNARTTIVGVRGATRLDVRAGRCSVDGALGTVEIENRAATLTVTRNHGQVRVSGQGGRLDITAPEAEVRADLRRTDITVELRRALPMNLSTSDARLELGLGGAPGTTGQTPAIQLDAVATDGEVRAPDWQLTSTTVDTEHRLEHAFGGATRVTLRTERGDIVVKKLGDVEIKKGQ